MYTAHVYCMYVIALLQMSSTHVSLYVTLVSALRALRAPW